jgi:hypothetical protein
MAAGTPARVGGVPVNQTRRPMGRGEDRMRSCIALLVLGGLAVAADKQPGKFKITTRKADDAVEVKSDGDRTVLVVNSPSGISRAVVERVDDQWPAVVVLRLHLKGLENFTAANGKVTLHAAVSGQDGKLKVRRWKDGKEDAGLDEKSPFWMGLRVLGGDGKPAEKLPLTDGYFEMTLPKAFFEGSPKSITLNWIDFYR